MLGGQQYLARCRGQGAISPATDNSWAAIQKAGGISVVAARRYRGDCRHQPDWLLVAAGTGGGAPLKGIGLANVITRRPSWPAKRKSAEGRCDLHRGGLPSGTAESSSHAARVHDREISTPSHKLWKRAALYITLRYLANSAYDCCPNKSG
jgi:hypothetical protein